MAQLNEMWKGQADRDFKGIPTRFPSSFMNSLSEAWMGQKHHNPMNEWIFEGSQNDLFTKYPSIPSSFMILQNTTTSIHKNGSVSKDDVCEKGCKEENEKARWKWPCLVSWLDSIMTSLLAPKENSRDSYFFAQTQTRSAISSGTCMHATKYPAQFQFSGPNIDFGLFECLSSAID